LPELCQTVGVPVLGNHSIRSSSIRALKRANFEDRDVATLSGHKNLANLSNYQIPTVTDRTRMAIRDKIHQILRVIIFSLSLLLSPELFLILRYILN
jgi:hypothetical protein